MKSLATIRPQLKIVFALLVLASVAYGQEIAKLERFVQATKVNTAAMQIFREGRDLIEAQNWQRAAEKFNEFISGYPKDKDLDAALYWYGYALQKQGRKEEAATPLVQLIKRFPNSSWRREAEALLVVLGREGDVKDALARDNCEIKILALQSLFQADEDRAVQIVTESLRANPTQCPGFQAAAVSILGRRGSARAVPILLEVARNNPDLKLRLTAIRALSEQQNEQVTDELIKIYDADRNKDVRGQILRALVESRTARGSAKVVEIARSGDDLTIRQMAIRYLGELKDTVSLDELFRIYDADQNKEIKMQVLRALAAREDPRARDKVWEIARRGDTPELRLGAIRYLNEHGRMTVDELVQLYTSETNLQLKQGLLRALAANRDPRAKAQLFNIARGSDSIELRAYAIRNLGAQEDEQTVTQLVAMYDGEQNLQMKTILIQAFGDSKEKVAVRKLMTIARSDPSIELRKVAVRYLGQSKDPEALKFLEELLK
ncbi:MAG TPA: HEAT repeat domain-containing protein [Pyrinomonadaceae bacterium]|nr:HEAT repeat domain-containing protein [Pyrinomonadaceae bacterium]